MSTTTTMEAHHVGVRELDLSACHVNTLSDKINAVPGLRTSTGKFDQFFPFLFFLQHGGCRHPPSISGAACPLRIRMVSPWGSSTGCPSIAADAPPPTTAGTTQCHTEYDMFLIFPSIPSMRHVVEIRNTPWLTCDNSLLQLPAG